jgi:septum formation protein
MSDQSSRPRLVLASASPRRQQLLREAGYIFQTDPADIDESDHSPALSPGEIAEYLARRKAKVVAARHPGDVVLAADTVVALGELLLGKPIDATDARRMLGLLSGSTHEVITAIAVLRGLPSAATIGFATDDGAPPFVAADGSPRTIERPPEASICRMTSTVRMRPLRTDEIERYVAGGAWSGKAGGYGLQDPDPFVTCTSGSPTNIVGLPMDETRRLLAQAGIVPIGQRGF